MLAGEYGEAPVKAMKLLASLGEVFDAPRMIRMKNAHISGVSYHNIGDAGLEFLEDLVKANAKVRVKATVNPAGIDPQRWREMGVPEDFVRMQLRILDAFQSMGALKGFTCIPYASGNAPSLGDHVAWGESSAVIYANSVLGARTNRESGISALASALTGVTPLYGYHLDSKRIPTLTVEVQAKLKGHLEYSALGYLIGKQFPTGVPYFRGFKAVSNDELKALSSGLGTSGAITMFHAENLTPQHEKFLKVLPRNHERVTVSKRQIYNVIEELSSTNDYDCVFLGCPQDSLEEIVHIAEVVEKHVFQRRVWVCTSSRIYETAERRGLISKIQKAGGLVLCDTCVEVCPLRKMGIKSILTDSCKAAQYVPPMNNVKVILKSTDNCLQEAFHG